MTVSEVSSQVVGHWRARLLPSRGRPSEWSPVSPNALFPARQEPRPPQLRPPAHWPGTSDIALCAVIANCDDWQEVEAGV